MKSAIFRRSTALICALVLLTSSIPSVFTVTAEDGSQSRGRTPRVVVSGQNYGGQIRFVSGVTYVGLREFSERQGAQVTWNSVNSTARAKSSSVELLARIGDSHLTANGRRISCTGRVFIESGRTYVPLRAIGNAFGYDTSWNSTSFTATMWKNGGASYNADELYWLSRIIHAEARGEPMQGKLAVGSVVLNRVKSREFPNTVYGVIFDRAGGVQFTPVANGEIYKTPDSDSIEAAKRCLNGERVSSAILFFINTDIAESFWITANRRYVMTVGNHDFYA